MAQTIYHLIDSNTGDEVYPSEGFGFTAMPTPEHRIHDADVMARYGGPAVVNRVEPLSASEFNVYIDGVEERLNAGNEDDENYRRS